MLAGRDIGGAMKEQRVKVGDPHDHAPAGALAADNADEGQAAVRYHGADGRDAHRETASGFLYGNGEGEGESVGCRLRTAGVADAKPDPAFNWHGCTFPERKGAAHTGASEIPAGVYARNGAGVRMVLHNRKDLATPRNLRRIYSLGILAKYGHDTVRE